MCLYRHTYCIYLDTVLYLSGYGNALRNVTVMRYILPLLANITSFFLNKTNINPDKTLNTTYRFNGVNV